MHTQVRPLRTAAHSILLAAALLSGCHKKAIPLPAPAPPPAPPAVMAAPPPPAAPMPPPRAVRVPPKAAAPLAVPEDQVYLTGTRVQGIHHRRASRSPASAGSASVAAPSITSAPDAADQQQVHTWYQNLPNGFVRYTVPTPMILGNQYTASAYIPAVGTALGAATTDPKKAKTVDKSIKVSAYMRVTLEASANPNTFKIDPPAQDCKLVSLDGATRWDFKVTPIHSGANQSLNFTTTVLYGDAAHACDKLNPRTIDVTTDSETVQVQAINARDTEQKLKDDAIQHPDKWVGYLKYILPGGAIFTFFAGIAAWWKKRSTAKPAA